jgi:hypothetical protein
LNTENIEYENFKIQLKSIEEITLSVNENKKKSDSKNQILDLQQLLKGKYQLNEDIDRVFLREINIKLTILKKFTKGIFF